MIRTVLVLLVALIFAGPSSAAAQPDDPNELTVFGGLSFIDVESTEARDVTILELPRRFQSLPVQPLIFPPPLFTLSRSLEASGVFGIRYGRDLTDTVTVVGDFAVAPAHDLNEEISYSCPEPLVCIAGPVNLVAPNVRFSENVVGYHYGAGLQYNLRRRGLMPAAIAGLGGVTYSTPDRARTHFTLRFGGRIAAPVGPLTTSIEVIDVVVTDHFVTGDVAHDVHARIGLGVRF